MSATVIGAGSTGRGIVEAVLDENEWLTGEIETRYLRTTKGPAP